MGSAGGLRGKVRKTTVPVEELLRKAATETEGLRADCLEHLGVTIGDLRAAAETADANGDLDGRRLDALAADIQGIAANFGFAFAARLAGLLRGEVAQRRSLPAGERPLVEAHVKALAAAHARGARADGETALQQALLTALGQFSRRARSGRENLS
ncbi:MAG: hypothetical protein FJX68_11000 [Alphaproteobacteria bacterium]|nr:hypothetical protein [Alphaproteobacteria bacterium]